MRTTYLVIVIITLLFNLLSCKSSTEDKNPDSEGKIYHPTKSNIPDKGLSSIASLQANNYELNSIGQKILETISSYEEITKISDGNNKFNNPLLNVTGAVIDKQNHILLLIGKLRRILVYSNNGEFITTIGRKGRGPGEFVRPKAIDIDKKGNIYVLDKFEIDVFKFQEGKYKSKKTIKHKLYRTIDLCLLNNKIFVSGFSVVEPDEKSVNRTKKYPLIISKPLHIYDKKGIKVKSFGKLYQSYTGWPVFTGRLSEMFLACNELSQTIVTTYTKFPFIRGYSKNGSLKWTSRIDDFSYKKIYEKSKPIPVLGAETTDDPINFIENLVTLGNGYSILQISTDVQIPNKNFSEIKKIINKIANMNLEGYSTFLINSKTGKINLLSNKLPKILWYNKNYFISKKKKSSLIEMINNHKVVLKVAENL